MIRNQRLFLAITIVICAARAFAQAGDEATVGWDPSLVGPPPDAYMYAVMIGGPLCGLIVGLLRTLSHRTTLGQAELIMVRFN